MSFQINPFTGEQDGGTGDTGYEVTGVPGANYHRRYVLPPDAAQINRRPNDPGWAIATGYTTFAGENGTTRFSDPVIAFGYNAHTQVGNSESTVHGWAYVLEADYYLAGGNETYDAQSCEAYVAYTRRQTTFDGISAPAGSHVQQRIFQWNVFSSESRNYTITNVTIANQCVISLSFTATDMPPRIGQKILLSGIAGTGAVTALNGTRQKIVDVTSQTTTSINVTLEYSTTGGTYTAATGTAAIDWEGTIGQTTLRGDNIFYACGNVHDFLLTHTLFGRNYFFGYQVDNRKSYTLQMGAQSAGSGVTNSGGAVLRLYQSGQNSSSNGVGSGYLQINTSSAVSGANNPNGNAVSASIDCGAYTAIRFSFSAFGSPANSPAVAVGQNDGWAGVSTDTTYSSNSLLPRFDVSGMGHPAANRTMCVRAGRDSTGELALFQSQNSVGGKSYFRIGNNAELILKPPVATPANPPNADEVSIYWDSTNSRLVFRSSAGVLKYLTPA
jgi:hypothetical protein